MKVYNTIEDIQPVPGTLVVWYEPLADVGRPFYVTVNSPEQAQQVMDLLQSYDRFLLEHRKVSESNPQLGLKIFRDKEWQEWYSDIGYDIHEWGP